MSINRPKRENANEKMEHFLHFDFGLVSSRLSHHSRINFVFLTSQMGTPSYNRRTNPTALNSPHLIPPLSLSLVQLLVSLHFSLFSYSSSFSSLSCIQINPLQIRVIQWDRDTERKRDGQGERERNGQREREREREGIYYKCVESSTPIFSFFLILSLSWGRKLWKKPCWDKETVWRLLRANLLFSLIFNYAHTHKHTHTHTHVQVECAHSYIANKTLEKVYTNQPNFWLYSRKMKEKLMLSQNILMRYWVTFFL